MLVREWRTLSDAEEKRRFLAEGIGKQLVGLKPGLVRMAETIEAAKPLFAALQQQREAISVALRPAIEAAERLAASRAHALAFVGFAKQFAESRTNQLATLSTVVGNHFGSTKQVNEVAFAGLAEFAESRASQLATLSTVVARQFDALKQVNELALGGLLGRLARGFGEAAEERLRKLERRDAELKARLEELLLGRASLADWVGVLPGFGLAEDDLGHFWLVLMEAAWREARDVARYVFAIVRRKQAREKRPLLGASAGTRPKRTSLAVAARVAQRPSAEWLAMVSERMRAALGDADEDDARVLELKLVGFSWMEVQERLGLTEKEREAAKRRASRRWRKWGFSGEAEFVDSLLED